MQSSIEKIKDFLTIDQHLPHFCHFKSGSGVGGGIVYQSLCPCDGYYFAITEVEWCEVDLPCAGVLRTGRVVAGVFTFGLSEVVNGGILD